MSEESKQIIVFDGFELDISKRRLSRGDEVLPLNAKAFDVLTYLAQNAGRIVTKEEILNAVWENQFVEEANLAVQISQLRKILGEKKENPRVLVTVPGKGYEFIAEIEYATPELSSESDDVGTETSDLQEFPTLAPEPAPDAEAMQGKKKPVYLHLVGAGILFLIIGAFSYKYFFAPSETSAVRSIAILPFTNGNDNVEAEYLSDGLSESLTFSLSGLPELRVASRNSAFRYKGRKIDAQTIGKELNVEAVLMGNVVNFGDRVSVSTELVSTADNSVIWGEKFVQPVSDIEFLQRDIAQMISGRLRLRLSGANETRLFESPTQNSEAYQSYLLGRYHLNKLTDEGFLKARDYFQQAVALDPNYAQAYAGLADAYNRLSGWNAIPQSDGFPKAKQAAIRALEINDRLAEAHIALGTIKLFYEWDWAGAESSFQKALEINPDHPDAHQMYSIYLTRMGRFDESLAEMRRAQQLDPLSLDKLAGIGEIFYYRRQFDQAAAQYEKILEIEPESGFIFWSLGNVYIQQKQNRKAIEVYQKAIPLSGGSPDEPASLAFAYAVSENRQEARKILEDLKRRSQKSYVSPVIIAFIHIGLGEKDEAFQWLEKAYEERDSILTLLKVEPIFDDLRPDARFSKLMKKVGFSD